jgi:asparagine N-glycosylation enzyme membrane subunit Stt3
VVERFEYSSLLGSDNYIIVVSLMIVAGIVVIIVGFLGCCGSIKDNRFMLIAVSIMSEYIRCDESGKFSQNVTGVNTLLQCKGNSVMPRKYVFLCS